MNPIGFNVNSSLIILHISYICLLEKCNIIELYTRLKLKTIKQVSESNTNLSDSFNSIMLWSKIELIFFRCFIIIHMFIIFFNPLLF